MPQRGDPGHWRALVAISATFGLGLGPFHAGAWWRHSDRCWLLISALRWRLSFNAAARVRFYGARALRCTFNADPAECFLAAFTVGEHPQSVTGLIRAWASTRWLTASAATQFLLILIAFASAWPP
jgi:hypothetical protein